MGENCSCLSLTVLSADPVLSCSRCRCSLNYCELKMDCVKSFKVSLFCKWSVAAIKGLGQHWRLHSFYSYILCMFFPFRLSPLRTNVHLEPAKATKVPNPCKTNWYSRGEEEEALISWHCVCSPPPFTTYKYIEQAPQTRPSFKRLTQAASIQS